MPRYAHLTLEDRERIAELLAEGLSLRAIGKKLGRSPSTLSRELARNALPSGAYRPAHAEGAYLHRRQRQAILERDPKLQRFVHQRLVEGWTPEQIAGWLKRGEERGLRALGTETIYSFIYRPGQREEKLWKLLPRGRATRRHRHARRSRGGIKGRASIHDRPSEIDQREKAGHWEGDLMICKNAKPILVLVERKSRLTLASPLMGKTAAETASTLMAVFRRLCPEMRASITFDNGSEFTHHALLRSACSMATWFCDAYASWQKGTIENTNGRLRRHLPRQLDLDQLEGQEIQEIVLSHNLTPRKCLGFLTPAQAFLQALGKNVQIRFA